MIHELSNKNKEQDILINDCQSELTKNRNEMSVAVTVFEDKLNESFS